MEKVLSFSEILLQASSWNTNIVWIMMCYHHKELVCQTVFHLKQTMWWFLPDTWESAGWYWGGHDMSFLLQKPQLTMYMGCVEDKWPICSDEGLGMIACKVWKWSYTWRFGFNLFGFGARSVTHSSECCNLELIQRAGRQAGDDHLCCWTWLHRNKHAIIWISKTSARNI